MKIQEDKAKSRLKTEYFFLVRFFKFHSHILSSGKKLKENLKIARKDYQHLSAFINNVIFKVETSLLIQKYTYSDFETYCIYCTELCTKKS